jgi:hypothetical protein
MSFQTTALVLAWVAIMGLTFLVSRLLHQVQVMSSSGHPVRSLQVGVAPGSPAPALDGHELTPGRASVIFFADDSCSSCSALLPHVTEMAERSKREIDVIVAYDEKASQPKAATPTSLILLEQQAPAFERFRIPATPFGIAVSTSATVIESVPISGPDDFDRLIDEARGRERVA